MRGVYSSFLVILSGCLITIGPISAQTASTDDEITRLRAELATAQQANAKLTADNQQAQQQIQSLQKEVASLKGAPEQVATNNADAGKIKNPWKIEISAGGNYATGNTNSYRGNLGFKAVRETERDQLRFLLNGEYGKTDDSLDADRLMFEVNYRHQIEDNFYWLALENFLHDGISDIDFRNTIGPGLGYYFIKNGKMTLLLEGGPAYVWERLVGEASDSTIRGRLAEEFDWQFSQNAKLFEHLEYLHNLQDTNDWYASLDAGIETSITKTISLRLSGRYQYQSQPSDDKKNGDFTAIGALVYKFQ